MAPKSPTKSLSTADNSDNNIDKDRPSWDTSPISKPGYLVTLCRWLPAQDENHRLLVERGVTMHRGRTVVVSDNHMDRHRHGLLPKGTFQKPTIVVSADHSDVGLPEAEALATPSHLQRRSPVLVSSRTCKPCRTHWISHAPLGLRCCIYGMAQAGRRWQRTLFPWLEEFGFKKCEHDSCIFKCEKEVITPDGPRNEVLTLGVYVDDLVTLYFHDDEHSLYHQFATELQKWDVEDERGRAHRPVGRQRPHVWRALLAGSAEHLFLYPHAATLLSGRSLRSGLAPDNVLHGGEHNILCRPIAPGEKKEGRDRDWTCSAAGFAELGWRRCARTDALWCYEREQPLALFG